MGQTREIQQYQNCAYNEVLEDDEQVLESFLELDHDIYDIFVTACNTTYKPNYNETNIRFALYIVVLQHPELKATILM